MFIRKIQVTPGRQYFVYIPKKIVDEMELGKGDYVIVRQRGRRIIIEKLRGRL